MAQTLVLGGKEPNQGANTPRANPKPTKGQKRQGSYTEAQIAIIKKAHVEDGLGYRKICKLFPGFGLTENGVKGAIKRYRETGAFDRKAGSGRPASKRAESNIALVKDVFDVFAQQALSGQRRAQSSARTWGLSASARSRRSG